MGHNRGHNTRRLMQPYPTNAARNDLKPVENARGEGKQTTWEADVLPLNYSRFSMTCELSGPQLGHNRNWSIPRPAPATRQRESSTRGILYAGLVALLLLVPLANAQTVPFEKNDSGLIMVTVSVNGHAARMVVDTGSVSTFITPEASGIMATGELRPNAVLASGRGHYVTFDIGSSSFAQPIIVLGMKDLSKRLGLKVDGILGQDFLTNFRQITIDYKAHLIEFVR